MVECIEQNQKQIFCWIQNKPLSLVMLKKPQIVLKNMFNFKSLWIVLIAKDVYLQSSYKKILEQQLNASVFLFSDCQQGLNFIRNSAKQEKIQILSGQYYLQKISNSCSKLLNVQGIIKCSIQNQQKRKFKAQFQYLLQKLKKKYKNNLQKKDLSSFLLIKDFPWDSYILLRTMKLMLRNHFPKQLLIQQLSKLIDILPIDDKYDQQDKQIFIKFLRNNKLSQQLTIQWYTKQSFLYPLINNILRSCRHPSQVFYIQPYFKLLFSTIKAFYQRDKSHKKNLAFTCYRGGQMEEEELHYFKQNIGCFVRNLCFLSTSSSKSFKWVFNVLINIDVEVEKTNQQFDYGFSFISKYSVYKQEQQILFNPLNFFRIISVQQVTKNQLKFYQIHLKYGIQSQENAERNSPEQNLLLYESQKIEKYLCFGQMFILQYHYLDYDHYWSKFSQLANNVQQKIYFYVNIYPLLIKKREIWKALDFSQKFFELIKATKANGTQNQIKLQSNFFYLLALMRYTYALMQAKQYQKAKQMLEWRIKLLHNGKEKQASILSAQCDLQCINHEYLKAAKKIEKGCQLVKDLYGEISMDYFFFLKKLGIIYLRARNYLQTSNCMNKCLSIIYQIYGENHLQAARICEYIAQNQINFGNNSQALINLNKSLSVKKKLFRQTHREFAEIYFKIGWVYKIQNNPKKGLQMLEKAEQNSIGLQQKDIIKIFIKILKGCLHRLMQKHKIALQILQDVQVLVQQQFGKISEVKMTILIQKALNVCQSQHKKAYMYLNQSKLIGRKIFGEKNKNIQLITQYYFIHSLIKKKLFRQADILIRQCEQLINQIGKNQGRQDIKYSYLKLKSNLYFDSRRFDKALQCYKRIYYKQKKKDDKSLVFITTINNIMLTCQKLEKDKLTLKYYQELEQIFQKTNIQSYKQLYPQINTITKNIERIKHSKLTQMNQSQCYQICSLDFKM